MGEFQSSCDQKSIGDVELRPPSLKLADENTWRFHAWLSYVFARHTRHDMVNVHCSLKMFETVESLRAMDPNLPLPPELQPQAIKETTKKSLLQLMGMSNDMVLLNQAANPAAYADANIVSVRDIMQAAVLDRLGEHQPHPTLSPELDQAKLLSMSDMINTAISTFYFQWSRDMTDTQNAAGMTVTIDTDRVTFVIPSDDLETTSSFARKLILPEGQQQSWIQSHRLSLTTTELALWLARFIITLHGGQVQANADEPDVPVHITLPRAA